MMDDTDQQLLMQRMAGRVAELEAWLALLVMRHGVPNSPGWQYRVSDQEIAVTRALAPRPQLAVAVSLDLDSSDYVIDVL